MKFLVDECVGTTVAHWLKNNGYDAISIYENMQGSDDQTVLRKAAATKRVLITSDKDFGDMIFRQQKKHHGIILLRLNDERPTNKIKVLKKVLENHSHEIENNFVVATEKTIRVTNPVYLH